MARAQGTYSESETKRLLTWLAKNLQDHGDSIFLLEQLQPTWLRSQGYRAAYFAAFSILLGILIGPLLEAAWRISETVNPSFLGESAGIREWLLLTPLWTLLIGALEGRRGALDAARGISIQTSRLRLILRQVAWGMLFNALWCVLFVIAWWFGTELRDPEWLRHPFIGGLILVALYEARIGTTAAHRRIRAVEALGRSGKSALFGGLIGTGVSLAVWIVFWLSNLSSEAVIEETLRHFWVYVPLGSASGALLGGLRMRMLKARAYPNQGIWLLLRNSGLAALLIAPLMSTLFFFITSLFQRTFEERLVASLWFLLLTSGIALLWFGGLEVLRHGLVRLLLALEGKPLHLVPFLEYATRLHFLHRAGGGYLFVHRYLMEHFAEMEEASEPGMNARLMASPPVGSRRRNGGGAPERRSNQSGATDHDGGVDSNSMRSRVLGWVKAIRNAWRQSGSSLTSRVCTRPRSRLGR